MIRRGVFLSAIPLASMTIAGFWGYAVSDAAKRFPVHWGLDGQPDRYGGPFEAFLALPLLATALTVVLAVLPALHPLRDNLRRSSRAYLTAWIGTLSLLVVVQIGVVLRAVMSWGGVDASSLPRTVLIAASLLTVALGGAIAKTPRNRLVGIRTPWTLFSDAVWTRTHRLVGPFFAFAGAAGFLASLTLPFSTAIMVMLIGVLGVTVLGVIFPYVLWRQTPDGYKQN